MTSADLLPDAEVCNFFVVPGAVRAKPLKNGAENASFLENSTACQKSTPVTFEKQISARTLCASLLIPAGVAPLYANV
ncbi:hypothetical protein, partial [Streptacidiphilus melanogenes]|uniref:hypothetical protein n=1 Tax=Streptacidiphilus melanogenes TaxID=411235 RepID=UPI001F2D2487